MRLKLAKVAHQWLSDLHESLQQQKNPTLIVYNTGNKSHRHGKHMTPTMSNASSTSHKSASKYHPILAVQDLINLEKNETKIFFAIDYFLFHLSIQSASWTQENADTLHLLCTVMVEMYTTVDEAVQCTTVKYLPSLLLGYFSLCNGKTTMLSDAATLQQHMAMTGTLESCLLAIYNHCVLCEPVGLLRTQSRFRIPSMAEGSVFHWPGMGQISGVCEFNSNGTVSQLEFKVWQEVNAENVYCVVMFLVRLFHHYIDRVDRVSHEVFCRWCYRLVMLVERAPAPGEEGGWWSAAAGLTTGVGPSKPQKKSGVSDRLQKSAFVSGAKHHAQNLLHAVRSTNKTSFSQHHKSSIANAPSAAVESMPLPNSAGGLGDSSLGASLENLPSSLASKQQTEDGSGSYNMESGAGVEEMQLQEEDETTVGVQRKGSSANTEKTRHPSGQTTVNTWSRHGVLPEALLVECLSPLYYILFEGSLPAMEVLQAFYMRSMYDGYAQVALIVNAIRASLLSNPSGAPNDGPMGIVVALSSTLAQMFADEEIMLDSLALEEEDDMNGDHHDSAEKLKGGASPQHLNKSDVSTGKTSKKSLASSFMHAFTPGSGEVGSGRSTGATGRQCVRAHSFESGAAGGYDPASSGDGDAAAPPQARIRHATVITNASFRTKKLPDDIPLQTDDTDTGGSSSGHGTHSSKRRSTACPSTITEEGDEVPGVAEESAMTGLSVGAGGGKSSARWRQTKL